MRTCSNCRIEDRPQLDYLAECSCRVMSPEPLMHSPECKAMMHEVVRFYVRISKPELTHDGMLSSYYHGLHWELVKDGNRLYRVKLLCRGCLQAEEFAQQRKREYERACKSARGLEERSYAQMLAQQSVI